MLGGLIILGVGLQSERQVDAVRMLHRTRLMFFGFNLWTPEGTPMPFALRFPGAVAGRESNGWFTSSRRGLIGGWYASGRAKRMASQANCFAETVESFEIAPADADRLAHRVIDLIAQEREFSIDFDDATKNLLLRTDDGTLIDTAPIKIPH